ncbi:MAG TPA: Ig-like domain-containing protein, partial [Thermoanaerobaculia bacterium]|nr:Ig-like domain-containing protein [Thermoanaerobaculia bacterium]
MDFKVLIDSDNNETTGCTVVTTAGLVKGVDHVLTTSVNFDGSTATVTGVTRQSCVDSVANTFSVAIPVATTGWSGQITSGGNFFVETFMPLSAFGGVTNMRYVFTVSSGNLADTVMLDSDGNKIIFPPLPTFRRHAANPAGLHTIILDNNDPDWAGVEPIAEGGPGGAPPLRFLNVRIVMDQNNVYFGIAAQSNKNAPTANDDTYSVERGKSIGVAVPGVLSNDTDPNNQPLTAILLAGTQHGALTLNADGSFNYQNDGSQAPNDSFDYKANNGSADSNTAHVTITITEPNAGPPPVKPAFTSPNATCFTVGTQKTFQITTTPLHPAVTVTEHSGTLPNGLSFSATPGSGTGQITGIAAAGTAGNYTLVFRATNAVGFTDQTFTLSVIATPTITPAASAVCAGSTGNTASGPAGMASYSWSISNGTITSGQNAQTVTWTAGTSSPATLTLTVTNSIGCSATGSTTVTINPSPAPPTITPSAAQVCAGSTGNTASGPAGATTYSWSIANGSITSATNIQSITWTAGAAGTTTLTLTVTNANGCPATNSANVTVNANPAPPTITPTPAQVCASSTGNQASGPAGATTYAWSISNGTITSATNIQTITYTAGASGTVGLTLVVTNAAGCSATNSTNVTINANPAAPTITPTPAQVCASSTGNQASGPAGATTYAWSITNGTITSATNTQNITYT